MPGQRMDTPTSTVERWGVGPGKRVWVGGHNTHAKAEIEQYLAGTLRPPEGPIDLAFIAPQSTDEAVYFAGKLRRRVVSDGAVWIVHPNARSPRSGEFTGNLDDLAVGMFELGFTQAGDAPLGNDYTSLGFRPGGDLGLDASLT